MRFSEAITILLLYYYFLHLVVASGEDDVDDEDVEAIWPMIRPKSVVGLSDRVVIGSVDDIVRPTTAPLPPPLLSLLLSQGSTGSTFGNNTSPLRSLDLVDGSA